MRPDRYFGELVIDFDLRVFDTLSFSPMSEKILKTLKAGLVAVNYNYNNNFAGGLDRYFKFQVSSSFLFGNVLLTDIMRMVMLVTGGAGGRQYIHRVQIILFITQGEKECVLSTKMSLVLRFCFFFGINYVADDTVGVT